MKTSNKSPSVPDSVAAEARVDAPAAKPQSRSSTRRRGQAQNKPVATAAPQTPPKSRRRPVNKPADVAVAVVAESVKAEVVAQPVVVPGAEVEALPVAVAEPAKEPVVAAEGKGKKKAAVKKPKLVRDSFTIPETEYQLIGSLKKRALAEGCEVKKSELLRAGLAVLDQMSTAQLLETLSKLERLKTGRPAN